MAHTMSFKVVALVLAAVLMVVAGTPARAEAIDALTILAIAGLAVAGIVIIAYLVVANVEGGKADQGRVIWVACADVDGCAVIPAGEVATLTAPVLDTAERQGP